MSRRLTGSARGFTLIELLVASALGVLVLLLVGGLLVSSMKAQSSVREGAQSSNTGQLVAKAITHDVRGARELSTTPPAAGSCLVRATVVDDALTTPVSVHYVAWYFGNGEIRSKRSTSFIAVPASAASVANWTLLASGVRQVGTTPVFAANGSQLDVSFEVVGSTGAPVRIHTTADSRQPMPTPSPGVSTPCP